MTSHDLLDPPVPTWSARTAEAAGSAVSGALVVTPAAGECEAGTIERLDPTHLTVGLGAGHRADFEAAGAAVGRQSRTETHVIHDLGELTSADSATYVESVTLGRWVSPRWSRDPDPTVAEPTHVVMGAQAQDVSRAAVRARSALLARTLSVTPSNLKTPRWFARQAVDLARRTGLDTTIWNGRLLAASGFGGIVAVGGGSDNPPRLVRLDYRPPGTPARGSRPVVIVGKGITFDTGGINLKPVDGMVAMKTDMAGAGVALAVIAACHELAVRVPVTVLIPLAENSISGSAYRPGDVITLYNGTTVEIGNTDAEGRIVLADAMAYAVAACRPRALIDIATLTGAARIALGRVAAPIFGTDDLLVEGLIAAGQHTGETLWRMPLPAAYREHLTSDVADIAQIAPGGAAGSVHAALFLREFAGDIPWAHLDIAGPGRSEVDTGILTKGGTGFGTRLLLRYLEGMS